MKKIILILFVIIFFLVGIIFLINKDKGDSEKNLAGKKINTDNQDKQLIDGQIAETMHKGRGMGMSDFSTENINKIKNYMLSKGYSLDKTNTLTDTEVLFDGS